MAGMKWLGGFQPYRSRGFLIRLSIIPKCIIVTLRRDWGGWIGRTHDMWCSNDFHKKAISPADRETLSHVKPIDKAIRDNYKWRAL
jgi:hypothetical protein